MWTLAFAFIVAAVAMPDAPTRVPVIMTVTAMVGAVALHVLVSTPPARKRWSVKARVIRFVHVADNVASESGPMRLDNYRPVAANGGRMARQAAEVAHVGSGEYGQNAA